MQTPLYFNPQVIRNPQTQEPVILPDAVFDGVTAQRIRDELGECIIWPITHPEALEYPAQ